MKQGQGSKRARGRNGGRRGANRQQLYDSNGPSVRIRGNAFQVHEKYLGLARDAASSGDRIVAENYYQHAEHYFRIYSTEMEERNQRMAGNGQAADGQRRRGGRGNGRAGVNGTESGNVASGTNGAGAPAAAGNANGEEQPTIAAPDESTGAAESVRPAKSAKSAGGSESRAAEEASQASDGNTGRKPAAGD